MSETSVVTWQKEGTIARVWLDREDRRNAMAMSFWSDLPTVFNEIDEDPEIRAVILDAKGSDFTVGLDLTAMGEVFMRASQGHAGRKYLMDTIEYMQDAINAVEACKAPVISVVHGWCIGGGVDLITACDIRIASADAKVSVRETKVAIVADLGTLQRLQKVIPRGHAAELVYTGKDVDAERAEEIGLFNHTLPTIDEARDKAQHLADEIAANSPVAVQGAKSVMQYSADRTIEEGLRYVKMWNTAFLQSNDLTEAMQAFIEKRDPEFTGE